MLQIPDNTKPLCVWFSEQSTGCCTHSSYKHAQKQVQPLLPAQENGPTDWAEYPGFQALIWIKQHNVEPDLDQPTTHNASAQLLHEHRYIRCFLEEEVLSWIRKKYSWTVQLRVCCCKHLSFISQQMISLGQRLQKIHWRLHQCNRAYTK